MTYFAKIQPKYLPVPENRRIEVVPFLEACRASLPFFDDILGMAFKPVKSDMQGNIDKLQKKYDLNPDKFLTINDMLEDEIATQSTELAVIGGLWLKRGLEYVTMFLTYIVEDSKLGDTSTETLSQIAKRAYDVTLKPFHNWLNQKIIGVVFKTVPNKKNFMRYLNNNVEGNDSQVICDIEVHLRLLTENVDVLKQLFLDLNLDIPDKV